MHAQQHRIIKQNKPTGFYLRLEPQKLLMRNIVDFERVLRQIQKNRARAENLRKQSAS
jgi:hypothetical protein